MVDSNIHFVCVRIVHSKGWQFHPLFFACFLHFRPFYSHGIMIKSLSNL